MRNYKRRLFLLENGMHGDTALCPTCLRPVGQQPYIVLPDNTYGARGTHENESMPCPICGSLPLVHVVDSTLG